MRALSDGELGQVSGGHGCIVKRTVVNHCRPKKPVVMNGCHSRKKKVTKKAPACKKPARKPVLCKPVIKLPCKRPPVAR